MIISNKERADIVIALLQQVKAQSTLDSRMRGANESIGQQEEYKFYESLVEGTNEFLCQLEDLIRKHIAAREDMFYAKEKAERLTPEMFGDRKEDFD